MDPTDRAIKGFYCMFMGCVSGLVCCIPRNEFKEGILNSTNLSVCLFDLDIFL